MRTGRYSKTGNWLTRKFFIWQQAHGEIKTQGEFAQWLGVPQSTLSNWLQGGFEAKGRSLEKIAARLNDFEIYDILGLQRPDERLPKLVARWDSMSETMRDLLAQVASMGTVDAVFNYVQTQNHSAVKLNKDQYIANIAQLARQLEDADLDALLTLLTTNREKVKSTSLSA